MIVTYLVTITLVRYSVTEIKISYVCMFFMRLELSVCLYSVAYVCEQDYTKFIIMQ